MEIRDFVIFRLLISLLGQLYEAFYLVSRAKSPALWFSFSRLRDREYYSLPNNRSSPVNFVPLLNLTWLSILKDIRVDYRV